MYFFQLLSSMCTLALTRKSCNLSMMSTNWDLSAYRSLDPKKELAYEAASNSAIKMPVVILVNPFLDANVGSVARAMLNFGLSELRVVDPRCDILSEQAQALAAGSVEILKHAKIYPTLKECVSDLQRVIATTARTRDMTQAILTPQAAANISITRNNDVKVGILFGRERNGLSNEELALADSYIAIPSFNYFSSLNLAQAVNIISYEIWKRKLELEEEFPPDRWLLSRDGDRMATRQELDIFLSRQETQLTKEDYQDDDHKRELCYRNIRSIYQRILMTKAEVDTLHGVLTTIIKVNNVNGEKNAK
eukprot:gene10583-22082_t